MSSTIVTQGNQTYIELSHGGQKMQVACNKDEAEKVKQATDEFEAKLIEKEKKMGVTPEQYMTAALAQQATKPEGVGNKLDVNTSTVA